MLGRMESASGRIGAFDAPVVYLFTDLRFFGRAADAFASRDEFFGELLRPFLSRGQTVLVHTFTYTDCGRFDVESTPTRLGALNKWICTQPGSSRSDHPLFSFGGIGPMAEELLANVPKAAFGPGGVHGRLLGRGAAFVHFGRPVPVGNTAVHYIEHLRGATYRYHKAFRTEVYRGGCFVGTDYTAFLRRRDVPENDFDSYYERAASELFARGMVREEGDPGRLANISLSWYDETVALLHELFERDPSVFIRKPYPLYD